MRQTVETLGAVENESRSEPVGGFVAGAPKQQIGNKAKPELVHLKKKPKVIDLSQVYGIYANH